MPDAAILDASGTLVSSGVVGAFLVLVIGALLWVTRQWMLAIQALNAEKDARLADSIMYATNTEKFAAQMEAVKTSVQASTASTTSLLEFVRDRGRA